MPGLEAPLAEVRCRKRAGDRGVCQPRLMCRGQGPAPWVIHRVEGTMRWAILGEAMRVRAISCPLRDGAAL